MDKQILVGIDPALRCTGYGVISLIDKKMSIIDCGVIRNPIHAPYSECLRRIAGGMRELIIQYQPQIGIIEGGFYSRNAKTAMILGMVRGVILSVMAEHELTCYEYAPTKAKQMITGYGRANKEKVAKMMASLLGIQPHLIPNDATDALSLCICHALLSTTYNGVYQPKSI